MHHAIKTSATAAVLAQAQPVPVFALVIVGAVMLIAIGLVAFIVRMYHKVSQGQALIVNTPGGTRVVFTGLIVLPIIHRAEIMDVRAVPLEIVREGADGMTCKDNIRVNIRAVATIQVNHTERDILRVAKDVGAARASDPEVLRGLFEAKLVEALRTATSTMTFEELLIARLEFRDLACNTVGDDLGGYVLEDLAIEHIEQTPLDQLDPENMLDAEAIRKIRLTTQHQMFLSRIEEGVVRAPVSVLVPTRDGALQVEVDLLVLNDAASFADLRDTLGLDIIFDPEHLGAHYAPAVHTALTERAETLEAEGITGAALRDALRQQLTREEIRPHRGQSITSLLVRDISPVSPLR